MAVGAAAGDWRIDGLGNNTYFLPQSSLTPRYRHGSEEIQTGQASGRHGQSPQVETAEDTASSAFQQDPDLGHSGPTLPVQLLQEVGLSQGKALASSSQTCESLGRTNTSEALGLLVSC